MLCGGTSASFASARTARRRLAGSVPGTLLPFHPQLELVVRPVVLEPGESCFNAARPDRFLTLDQRARAVPRLARLEALHR